MNNFAKHKRYMLYIKRILYKHIVVCPLKQFNQRRRPLLGYGTINSDATMQYVMLRHTTNGSTAVNAFSVGPRR
jgi:hypothetical protein